MNDKSDKSDNATPEDGAEYIGVPVNPKFGTVKGKQQVSVTMRIISGPLAGWEFPYTVKKWTPESMSFDIPRLKAAGWKGFSFTTFESDIKANANSLTRFRVRLAEHEGNKWWTADRIGVYVPVVNAPTAEDVEQADEWLAEFNAGQRPDEAQDAAGHSTAASEPTRSSAPVVADDDLPF